ncbi:aflatoxin regulatory protein-domain-containing protein [Biscogniauxia marginata]|nr:aflatoxin regulatory protein-domain-containing protein [Biscogniauxia marginata]
MAELHSPARLPTPSPSTGRRSSGPTAPKLRDSCHACASSKVKCHKEKPTCSRCAKRGLTCEYVATKRGGRKHDHRSSISERRHTPPRTTSTADPFDVNQFMPSLNSWFTPANLDSLPSPGMIHQSPKPTTCTNVLFPGLLSPANPPMSSLPDLSTELDDFFNSPLSFPVGDPSDTDILGQANFFSTGLSSHSNSNSHNNSTPSLIEPFPLFENAITEISLPSSDSSPPMKDTLSYLALNDTISAEPPACSCLFQALGLMKQLFPNQPTACRKRSPSTQGVDKPNTPTPTVQDVVAKNEATIEAVSAMLQCPCSHDGYLLTIMSLIVFKVLGWYAAAARKSDLHGGSNSSSSANSNGSNRGSPSPHASPKSEHLGQEPSIATSDYCLDGEDSGRMAAQLVLSELHRVQRLVNQLSQKLKIQAAKKSGAPDTPDSSGFSSTVMDYETGLPLSAVMLDQLEADLRKRLKSLSLEIVEGLRRE